MKRLILVTSPPASGKTYISKQLAKALNHVMYLDKDTLIVLSHQIFRVMGEEENRSSEFFQKHIRDFEYDAILDLAFEGLAYTDNVLINAPFTQEIRDPEYVAKLKARLAAQGARLCVVWVMTDVDVVKQRMIERDSDRDTWKLANWDEYIASVDFSIPSGIDDPEVADDLILFRNSSTEEFEQSMQNALDVLQ
ncbi:AAA family ATPase [Salinibius halmophilus]|uniref:AAA family ATPase n=1 Tax=Salinibius halmophilus TaxID=1853216 RepID=UPI000E662553|nr:AAA family ATPase [Salinibius halmophilus]